MSTSTNTEGRVRAVVIKACGKTTRVEPGDGEHFSLEEMQAIVGGNIQVVRTCTMPQSSVKEEHIIIMNADGKLLNLPQNWKATIVYDNPRDFIVGDVLVCEPNLIE